MTINNILIPITNTSSLTNQQIDKDNKKKIIYEIRYLFYVYII